MTNGTIQFQLINDGGLAISGTDTFDFSKYLNDLLSTSSEIKDNIIKKVNEIVKNVNSKTISDDLTEKIKKSFNIDVTNISKSNIKINNTQNDVPTLPKELDIISNYIKTKPDIKNLVTQNSTLSPTLPKELNILSNKIDNLEKIIPTNQPEDSVFDTVTEVIVTDFSDKALEKLSKITTNYQTSTTDSEKKQKPKSFLDKLFDGFSGVGGFNDLLKSVLGKSLPASLSKLGGGALLGAGLVWMAVDGIRGWFASDEWGVSKISGMLGGIFGGMSSGMEGAFKNAGKFALVGAGIGTMIAPGIGTIIGGVVGAVVGGILGFIGGEKLAKSFDAIGNWFNKNIIDGLFGGMDNIKEKFAKIGSFFTVKVGPFIKDVFLDGINWIENTLLPAIKNLFAALKPIFIAIGWLIENVVWPLTKILSTFIINNIKKAITNLFDYITFAINWFVEIGKQIGIVSFWLYEKFLWVKDKFIKFGEAIGEGAFIIYEWVSGKFKTIKEYFINIFDKIIDFPNKISMWLSNIIDNTIEQIKNGFNLVFDFFKNLGPMLLDRFKNWFSKDKNKDKEQSTDKATTKAQDIVIDYKNPKIQIQPDKSDKMYEIENGTVFAKSEGALDKKLESVNNSLISLQKNMETNLKDVIYTLNTHTDIFMNMLGLSKEQLQLLPALIPQQEKMTEQIPSTKVRDPIFDYRNRVYNSYIRG